MATLAAYIHVKKEQGILRVKGIRQNKKDEEGFLFCNADQDLSKHPHVASLVKGQNIQNYRNVQISGLALASYYNSTTDKFVFNGVNLIEDDEKSLVLSEEGELTKINDF